MGLLNTGILGIFFNDGPSFSDKVDMLFTDVETEGKKQGYLRAAAEYEKVFKDIETEYINTKKLIDSQKDIYDKQADVLIEKLEELEYQRDVLEVQVKQKEREISEKYGIRQGCISNFLTWYGIFNCVYQHKERKLREAEQRGYREAKELYEAKIDKLKRDLEYLKSKGNSEIRELVGMLNDILKEIAEEQMKIAELEIILQIG